MKYGIRKLQKNGENKLWLRYRYLLLSLLLLIAAYVS